MSENPSNTVSAQLIEELQQFFAKPVAKKGMGPIRTGVEIAIYLEGKGPVTLAKEVTGPKVITNAPGQPDISLRVPSLALTTLNALETEDVGTLGVEILKLMANSDPKLRIHPKVHIGILTFIRNGYLGVLPLGGATVMKYLASKGLTSIGKIRDAIAKLRE